MHNKTIKSYAGAQKQYKEFKEFDKHDKEKIAAVVEIKSKEFMLSPIITDFVYASSRALDFGDYHGVEDSRALWSEKVNRNGDYFDVTVMEENIPYKNIKRFETFRTASMFMDHNSKNVENSIGHIFDAYLVKSNYEDMHCTILFGIDKTKAPRIARTLETIPEKTATSMGCSIEKSTCTVCGEEKCSHLQFMRNGSVGGKKVAEYLHGVEFFEDSIVTTPACHTAYVIDALSEIISGRMLRIASESTDAMVTAQIMASIYGSIKTAKTHAEKVRLSDNFDKLMLKLESLTEGK